jgi:nitroimidazol reductase NimA-like FMN-containing flavoprotein (pyridoxamine 5'-phosphate oxidase superfamily)
MTIHELTAAECEAFLGHAAVGRLGCSHGGQPYVVPVSVYFGREERCLYGFSTVGTKIEWMRENPKVLHRGGRDRRAAPMDNGVDHGTL